MNTKDENTSTYFRSCRRSLALSIVMSEVVAAGMMMMGVRDPVEQVIAKEVLRMGSVGQTVKQRQLYDRMVSQKRYYIMYSILRFT